MVIVGVDPGSRVTGYGVVSEEGGRCRCLGYGTISTQGGRGTPIPDRLEKIHRELGTVLDKYEPDVVAVEEVFYAANVKSALILGHARGVVLLAAAQREVPVTEYSALEVKKAVTGYGRAEKGQIQHMVKVLLGLKQEPQPDDAADALAVALCRAFNNARPRTTQSWRKVRL